ncbi:MAG: AI-2E family transporter [Bacteroidetes bacterium]|nr:MAG: AI-2E family transporter [Bacteroidota bacterium]
MKELYDKNKLFFFVIFIAAIGFLVWYFSNIVSYILIAAVVSLIGNPLVRLMGKIHIGRFKFPHLLAVILTLVILLAAFIGFFSFFVPLIVTEAQLISSINVGQLSHYYQNEITWIEQGLIDIGILNKDVSIMAAAQDTAMRFISVNMFSSLITHIFTFTGTFFFDLFSVLFISFFFLLDPDMVRRIVLTLMPDKYADQTNRVLDKSKHLLSRYFIGLFLDVLAMIISYAIGLSIIGVEGALVIAFFAGIINIIPYLGPLIGTSMGIILGITTQISIGQYGMIGHTVLMILLVFLIVIVIDNVVYQPLIYGKSVKAHPIEIFLVIIAAGSIGGIIGMIIAVPTYTFLRIIAHEFLNQFKVVRSLTDKL